MRYDDIKENIFIMWILEPVRNGELKGNFLILKGNYLKWLKQ